MYGGIGEAETGVYKEVGEEKEGTEAKCKKCGKDYQIYGQDGLCDDCRFPIKPAPSETSVLTSEDYKWIIHNASKDVDSHPAQNILAKQAVHNGALMHYTEARVLEKERKRTELSIECWRDAYDQQKEDYHLLLEKKNAEIDALKQELMLKTSENILEGLGDFICTATPEQVKYVSKLLKVKDNRIRELEQENAELKKKVK